VAVRTWAAVAQQALANDLLRTGSTVTLPPALDDVIEVAGQAEGVRLGEMIAILQPDRRAAEDALAEILRAVGEPH
jgi:hypothetical protein